MGNIECTSKRDLAAIILESLLGVKPNEKKKSSSPWKGLFV
jgi:hypothetical protein